ncbi:MAG: hypothetical protein M3237_20930 [Actinomycetota bacterium]|nr:hypothetical protein [Actinomycetota bacterium]
MADHRHKRDTNARRKPKAVLVAGPLAVLATASAVTLGVLGTSPDATDFMAANIASGGVGDRDEAAGKPSAAPAPTRDKVLSRSSSGRDDSVEKKEPTKVELMLSEGQTQKAINGADQKLWTQAPLNIWTKPGEDAQQQGVLEEGIEVLVTGRSLYGRDEVVLDGESRWVTAGYLSTEEPSALGGDCTNGSSVPSGVSPNIVAVHEAVCSEFPEITSYGTFRSDGEHSQGLAIDIMVSGERGWEVAEFVREYYSELGVSYIIYSQNIWSVERSGEGWRPMEDRGSTTANHYDHVHVTTY